MAVGREGVVKCAGCYYLLLNEVGPWLDMCVTPFISRVGDESRRGQLPVPFSVEAGENQRMAGGDVLVECKLVG